MPGTLDLGSTLGILRRRWRILLLVTLVVSSLVGVYTLFATRIYQADTTLLVEDPKGSRGVGATQQIAVLDDLLGVARAQTLETQIAILQSPDLQRRAYATARAELAYSVAADREASWITRLELENLQAERDEIIAVRSGGGDTTATHEEKNRRLGQLNLQIARLQRELDQRQQVIQARARQDRSRQLAVHYLTSDRTADHLSSVERERLRAVANEEAQLTRASDLERRQLRISVTPVKSTDIIRIRVQHPNSELAASVANAMTDIYIRENTDLSRKATVGAREFVQAQLATVRSRLNSKEDALSHLQSRYGNVDIPEETKHRIQRLQAARAELASAESDLQGHRRQIALIRQRLGSVPSRIVTERTVTENPVVRQLQLDISNLQQARQKALVEFQPDQPEVTSIDAQIRTAKERLTREVERRESASVTSINPERQALEAQHTTLLVDSLAIAARRSGLERVVQAEERQLRRLPDRAMQVARLQREIDGLKATFTGLNQSLQQLNITEKASPTSARVVDYAQVPTWPVKPRSRLNLALGLLCGLLLGLATVIVQEQLDQSVKSPDDIERMLNLPVLGVVPFVREAERRLVHRAAPQSAIAETYRMLRSSLNFATVGDPLGCMVVTSAQTGEGKSTTAANTAVMMAQRGMQVILVDADLRRPTQHKIHGVPNTSGFSSLVVGTASIEEALVQTETPGLRLLPCGPLPPNPAELLDSERARQLVRNLRDMCDLVILDVPPCAFLADAAIAASMADGVLLVVQANRTEKAHVARAYQVLRDSGARILGVVVNMVRTNRDGSAYYYGGYGYGYYSADRNGRDTRRHRRTKAHGELPTPTSPPGQ